MTIHRPDPRSAGKPYRPSNGTEGMMFESAYCDRCIHFVNDESCDILIDALIYEINEPNYPKEWVYDSNGNPTCTKFQKVNE